VAAVIIEPVTGEGGFHPAPDPSENAAQWCDKHGAASSWMKSQTGFGRTGTLFACEQLGVVPDSLCSPIGLAQRAPAFRRHGQS
jgi:4-aminobutyrate aminotransferase/(S)-3-amino-2-methylpropionate transaminase